MEHPAITALNLKVVEIPRGRPNRPGARIVPTHVTIHNTDNTHPGANAMAHGRFASEVGYYMLGAKRNYISWHFTVDDQDVVQHLPLNEIGWHAGKGNRFSIGVECCMNKGIDQDVAFERMITLVAAIMININCPPSNIVTHHYWTKKNCPSLLLSDFAKFVAACSDRAKDLYEQGLRPGSFYSSKYESGESYREEFDTYDLDERLLFSEVVSGGSGTDLS